MTSLLELANLKPDTLQITYLALSDSSEVNLIDAGDGTTLVSVLKDKGGWLQYKINVSYPTITELIDQKTLLDCLNLGAIDLIALLISIAKTEQTL